MTGGGGIRSGGGGGGVWTRWSEDMRKCGRVEHVACVRVCVRACAVMRASNAGLTYPVARACRFYPPFQPRTHPHLGFKRLDVLGVNQ